MSRVDDEKSAEATERKADDLDGKTPQPGLATGEGTPAPVDPRDPNGTKPAPAE